MLRLGLLCPALIFLGLAQGCCSGPCGVGGGNECGPLAADFNAPACGGCGNCLQCRRWGALQAAQNLILCHNGCGDLYYDEWYSDPPAPRDPCDYCYCPGPFRRAWWDLVALHTAPRPGCYTPTCGQACGQGGNDWADGDYADDGAYYGDEYPATIHSVPGAIPHSAPQPQMRPMPSAPTTSRSLGSAQADWNPNAKLSGVRFVPRRTLTVGR